MRHAPASVHAQRGAALLTAILVVAVGTILAVNLMWEATLDQRRTEAALAADQGLAYLHSAEAWAADILRQDLVESPDVDHLGEIWATELPPMNVEGGVLAGRLEDLQGRFNLNNLVAETGGADETAMRQFQRLLVMFELDPLLADAVIDWLDPDSQTRFPRGAEDVDYANADPPYRAANTFITTPSELMAVAGFDQESYEQIAPYVTALPPGTTLNVNTASAPVLASLSDELDLTTAARLVEQRGEEPFLDIENEFAGWVEPGALETIDGVSEHFLLIATVTLGTSQLNMRSVLQRDASGIARPLFRSLGVE